jgi:hypothetical protein
MKGREELPPITVYQLGNRYFVIDGHTRVAAAKALGIEFIDADVTEALPRKEGEVNLTYYARREFERATCLEGFGSLRPGDITYCTTMWKDTGCTWSARESGRSHCARLHRSGDVPSTIRR